VSRRSVLRALTGCILLAAAAVLPSVALAADAETTLAERYAPVIRLVNQEEPCGHGEAYQPTDVSRVLGNPDVAFRGPWDKTNIIKVGPTATDLARGLFDYHLDFPGTALAPGCVYDEWSHRLNRGHAAHAYARVVTDSTYPGQLALQYWLFYVFNDFNDKHEGDWEMIQLNFDAGTAAEALRKKPALVGFSQHEGPRARTGATRSWRSSTVRTRSCIQRSDHTRTTSRRRSTSGGAPPKASAATTPPGRPSSSARRSP
jgi:hypothetical protein